MYRIYFIILIILLSFFSCGKQQTPEKQKKEISFSPPIIIHVSHPIITLLDTCSEPIKMVVPKKGINNYTILTNGGPKNAIFPSPIIHTANVGESAGFSIMKNFNTEQGLALSTVWCGYKDKAGNLWFGTMGGGVSKYDGKSFTNYTASQGLAANLVKCIIEDKEGNLWFGTNGGGVSKYDGKSFKNFTIEQGLPSNMVLSILEDKDGNLWFSTDGGLCKYDPKIKKELGGKLIAGLTVFTVDQGLLSNHVLSSRTDKKGNLWFGTSKGICKYNFGDKDGTDAKLFTNYTTAQGLSNNYISSIGEDKSGNMWFGSLGGGLSRLSPELFSKNFGNRPEQTSLFTNFNHTNNGLLGDFILNITTDKSGNLWFSTGGGISKYDPTLKDKKNQNLFTNYTPAQGLTGKAVFSITEDKTGSLWIGTDGGGLCKYDGKSFTSFTTDQGLIFNKVWSIVEDKKENLWFGTSSGVSVYDKKSFTNFNFGYIMSNVRCIIEDKRGNIWFGSGYGVTKYDGKNFMHFTTAQGLAYNSVLSIAEDKTGNIWFGTYGGGVSKYDGNRIDAIEKGESYSQKNIQDLKKINGKYVRSFTNYTTAQGLAGDIVKCIKEDNLGNMWFGTNGNGLSKLTCPDKAGSSTFTNYTGAQGLSHNTILSILKDKTGALWFGTAGGGVCKYKPSEKESNSSKPFTTYATAQGLANDVVYGMVEDTLNNTIWFGTNLGFSGLKLNSLSTGTDEIKFENFNNKTGYPIKDLNTGAILLDKKGIIWAGTSDKLVRFDYSGINKSAEPPAVFIKAVKIQGSTLSWYNLKAEESNGSKKNKSDSLAALNEEINFNDHPLTEIQRETMRKKFGDIKFDSIRRFYPLPENLVLPFVHNNVTFDFLAIETNRPFMVDYQFILEGYDKDWSPLTNATTASFGNIQEGSYTFKLKARSPDGIWSEPVVYTFKVLPPWYRTWWMYLCYLFIGVSVIRLFFKWRTASLIKEKEILEQTVIERTTEVVEQKELIEEKQKEIVDSINYAKRIQYALLANDVVLEQNLQEHFVLFQPKDIVSGDFYWATKTIESKQLENGIEEKTERFYLAICDSTGHGVPGAFMSLLNISFLNEAITEKNIKQPNEIFNHARQRLIESVSQEGAQDGMDGILLCFENNKITYAAANNAPVIVRGDSIINLPSDKMPIGKGERNNSFTHYTVDSRKGDMIYFCTDGYADQFGGPKGKKFKYKQLEELLISVNQKSLKEQKQILETTIEKWKGNLEQVDDILIIGLQIGLNK